MLDVAGTRVGVQHQLVGRTRMAWVWPSPHGLCNVEVCTPLEPVDAVAVLADSWLGPQTS